MQSKYLRNLQLILMTIILATQGTAQDTAFQKVFVLGNSLTIGFGTHGMAATSPTSDYFFWVQKDLLEKNTSVVMTRAQGADWEAGNGHERTLFLSNELPKWVHGDEDLIIIQLGDNVNTEEKRATFLEDVIKLVDWFHETCPNARIVWVFGWYWESWNMPLLKEANEHNDHFEIIDITGFKYSENGRYQNAVGNTYINSDGIVDTIQSTDIATHPNDEGMLEIASRIIDHLNVQLAPNAPELVKAEMYSLNGSKLREIPRNQVFLLREHYADGTIKVFKNLMRD